MNEIVRNLPGQGLPTTQAAEGVPRLRWTTADLIRLTDLGIFRAEDRLELIGGEIVPMSPIGRRHEVVAEQIEDALRARAPADVRVRAKPQLNLTDDTCVEPDIFVMPAHMRSYDVRGDTVLLVIEVAKSSLDFDLGMKARTYARHGVRDYWVVNADTLATRVHRQPGANGFAEAFDAGPEQSIAALLAPALAVRMRDLDLD